MLATIGSLFPGVDARSPESPQAARVKGDIKMASVLPKAVRARLAVEAGATLGWWKYVGSDGRVLGIDRFGASGKAADLFPHFGFTADNVGRQIRELIG